jgi:hypothetical protein
MGVELLISNPATSGSHSWKCILVSNTSDSAFTKLGYCGRRERFSSDTEVARVFWKLWHSKKEYLDLPESISDELQKFDMVCKAMQAGFDPFDWDEESGEDELEDMRDFIEMPHDFNPHETYVAESSENMVGECGYCASMQGYTPENMLLIADYPELSHDFCKSCKSHHPDYKPTDECEDFKPRNPDVYEGQTWFCQGCGSGTEFLIDANKWVADAETFASETCECGELEEDDGEMYECSCCEGAFCVDCIENGDISAAIGGYRPAFLDNPRITETDTAYMDPQGVVCGECMTNIENELNDLTPIHEIMEDEQGTANLASESKELKRTSCCCGATESSPCACMYEGVMNCSATAPMCPCYKALAEKNAESPTTTSKSKHITEIILITALIGGVIASMKRK